MTGGKKITYMTYNNTYTKSTDDIMRKHSEANIMHPWVNKRTCTTYCIENGCMPVSGVLLGLWDRLGSIGTSIGSRADLDLLRETLVDPLRGPDEDVRFAAVLSFLGDTNVHPIEYFLG